MGYGSLGSLFAKQGRGIKPSPLSLFKRLELGMRKGQSP